MLVACCRWFGRNNRIGTDAGAATDAGSLSAGVDTSRSSCCGHAQAHHRTTTAGDRCRCTADSDCDRNTGTDRYQCAVAAATPRHRTTTSELLDGADPPITASPGSPPRVYDLRHAHVVEVINRWARAGRDPEALVIYLSLHLGHTNPDDTWYYFHLAPDFHPDLRRLANTDLETTLPEASHAVL